MLIYICLNLTHMYAKYESNQILDETDSGEEQNRCILGHLTKTHPSCSRYKMFWAHFYSYWFLPEPRSIILTVLVPCGSSIPKPPRSSTRPRGLGQRAPSSSPPFMEDGWTRRQTQTDCQADRQADTQVGRQTGRPTSRETGRRVNGPAVRQVERQTVGRMDTHTQTDRQIDRE